MNDERELAAAIRDACIAAVRDAYEEAGVRGMCGEGRWEYALDALRRLDLAAVLHERRKA